MALKPSKSTEPARSSSAKSSSGQTVFRAKFHEFRQKIWIQKSARVRLHRSFHRSYREDYVRDLEIPGLLHHALSTFKLLFKNWRVFVPFLFLIVIFNIFFVGILSEDTYKSFQNAVDQSSAELANGQLSTFAKSGLLLVSTVTTGGLTQGMTEVQQVFAVLFFVVIWLVTIYLLRHFLVGHQPRLRDGLYNALAPLISSFFVVVVLFIQAIPIMLVIITYSAAVQTEFLETPFYALLYFIFAVLLLLLSGYLISSSFLALIAVSAPGLYPMAALHTASDLIAGRRIRLIIRLIYLVFVLAICWVVIMLPLIMLDLWLKSIFDWLANIPIVPFAMLCMTVFSAIYFTAYSYLYYRRILDYDD